MSADTRPEDCEPESCDLLHGERRRVDQNLRVSLEAVHNSHVILTQQVLAMAVQQEKIANEQRVTLKMMTDAAAELAKADAAKTAAAVEKAMRRVLTDEELRSAFWKAGYDELSRHAQNGTTQWVGRRMVSMFSGVLLAAALYLGVRFGGWGK